MALLACFSKTGFRIRFYDQFGWQFSVHIRPELFCLVRELGPLRGRIGAMGKVATQAIELMFQVLGRTAMRRRPMTRDAHGLHIRSKTDLRARIGVAGTAFRMCEKSRPIHFYFSRAVRIESSKFCATHRDIGF